MRRTTEPELMESPEQVLAYAEADFGATDDAFVTAFLAHAGRSLAGTIVDLGCGPGNISIRLARALPHCTVVGVDGSEAMLSVARRDGASYQNLRFLNATLPSTAVHELKAVAILSNSLLHHLHDPDVLWRAILATATEGAPVVVGDLRRPPSRAEVEALVAQYANGDPEVLRRDFRASLHAAFEVGEIRAQLATAGLQDFIVKEVGDRHVLVAGNVPGTW